MGAGAAGTVATCAGASGWLITVPVGAVSGAGATCAGRDWNGVEKGSAKRPVSWLQAAAARPVSPSATRRGNAVFWIRIGYSLGTQLDARVDAATVNTALTEGGHESIF